jgi:lysophospholipase L1-like esterase
MKLKFTYLPFFLLITVLISNSINAQNKIEQNWIEWANFKKYATQNSSVPAPAMNEKRVVFLGNSIFEGWLSLRPEFFAGKPYYDRGISGQTTPQMLLRFYDDVVALNPTVLVLKAGINDIAQNNGPYDPNHTFNNIKSIVLLAKANKIKVVLCSVLPANDFRWRPGLDPADKVIALNENLKAFAKSSGTLYLDLYSSVVDDKKGMKKEYSEDGVHPNVDGYKVMELLVEKAIKSLLK